MCMSMSMSMCMCMCLYVRMNVWTYVRTYVCIYNYMPTIGQCTYNRIYIYIRYIYIYGIFARDTARGSKV